MKNLKRILSLALASVMVVGMMVVGASAADFNDKADIDHAEAVETLVALGIISGKENNNFDPDGLLTRAEMATIIAVIRNRGVAPKFGVKTTPTYSDIDNHWAESYIEYCNSFGIVGGIGGGKFDPEGKLTSTQAARMLLNAMGYGIEDPSNWALLTEVQARTEGIDLYADIDEEIADPTNDFITRDQMAQMAFNALYGTLADSTVTRTDVYRLVSNDDDENDLGHGTFTSAADAKAFAEVNLEEDSYKIARGTETQTDNMAKKYLGVNTSDAAALKSISLITKGANKGKYETKVGSTTYIVSQDYSNLMGQQVQVLTKGGDETKVYGIVDAGGAVVYTGTVGEYKNNYAAATGTTKTNMGNVVLHTYNDYDAATAKVSENNAAYKNEYSLKVVANASGKPITGIVTPAVLSKVSYVGSSSITLAPAVNGIASYKTDDYTAFSGMSKGDYVVATPGAYTVDGKTVLVEAESVVGQATSKRANGSVRVNGTWYPVATGLTVDLGDKGTMLLVNGIIAKVDVNAEAASTDLAVIVAVDDTPGSEVDQTAGKNRARILLTDGTMKVVTVDPESTVPAADESIGKLVTYSVDKELYSFEEVDDTAGSENLAGYDGTADTVQLMADGALTSGLRIADDAVVVILHNTSGTIAGTTTTTMTKPLNEDIAADTTNGFAAHTAATTVHATGSSLGKLGTVKVLTGKEVKAWGTKGGDNTNAIFGANVGFAMVNGVNGIDYAQLVILMADAKNLPDATAGSENYGWVIANNGNEYVAETKATYTKYTIWDGEAEIEVMEKGTTNYDTGDIVTFAYTDAAKGYVEITDKTSDFTTGAVTGYSEADGVIKLLKADDNTTDSTVKKVDDKTVFFFIDSANETGVVGGSVQLATKANGITFANIKYDAHATNTDTVGVAFIDVANNWADTDGIAKAPEDITSSTATSAFDATKPVVTFSGSGAIAGQGTPTSGWANMVGFVFDGAKEFNGTANATVQAYTLTVYNSAGNMVYREVAPATTSAAVHVFYLDKTGAKLNATTVTYPTLTDGAASGAILEDGCSYSFTIIGNTDGRTYASGAFTL